MDSEKEWSDNKKLIELSKPQYAGNIRKAVPKGFPYFAINFGLQPGYVHVVENKEIFPDTFAQVCSFLICEINNLCKYALNFRRSLLAC
jgi:hypothetical protein